MTTQAGTPEEQFVGAIKCMSEQFDRLVEDLERKQCWLGSAVADNPKADHSRAIAEVKIAEAKRDTAAELIRTANGFRMGMFVAKPEEKS